MSNEVIPDRLRSPEDGQRWVEYQVEKMMEARAQVDILSLPNSKARRGELEKMYQIFLVRYGGALSGLEAMRLCGMVSEVAYRHLRAKIEGANGAKLVGR